MNSRPDIELSLDIRSYEHVVVIVNPDASHPYPEHWVEVHSRDDLNEIHSDCVVVVDRVDVSPNTLSRIAVKGRPRILALVPNGVEQEKLMRRTLATTYPWAEVWTVSSSFGKLLVAKDVVGAPYDRELIRDERPVGEA